MNSLLGVVIHLMWIKIGKEGWGLFCYKG